MSNNENILILKLDEFIRRYYKNQLIRGSLYAAGILLSAFLAVTLLEYYGRFSQFIRGILFFGFVSSTLFVVTRFIVVPLLKLYRIGDVISYDQAASIIGVHFSNVQDKLLNVLQLRSRQALHHSDDLLLAGIEQKIEELRPVPFAAAVDLSENRRYLKFVLPLILLTLTIAAVWPHIFSKSADRLVNYATYYEKEMPFTFHVLNKKMEALQSQDFKLDLELKGGEVPAEVFVEMNGIEYKLEKTGTTNFYYVFPNVQTDLKFRLSAAGFYSRPYEVEVLPRPSLQQFNVQLVFPGYLKRAPEQLVNTGDLQVPEGTKATWIFNTRNTEMLEVRFADTMLVPNRQNENQFAFSRSFFSNNRYTLRPVNRFVNRGVDSVTYGVNVIPDRAPSIELTTNEDTLQAGILYFSGQIRDDYGFSSLNFYFKRSGTDSTGQPLEISGKQKIPFNRSQLSQPYFHYFDATQFTLRAGEKVEYYFEVFDNDGVNGPKSSRTRTSVFKAPTKEELSEAVSKSNEEIKKNLEDGIKKAERLQKEINDLARKISDKQKLGYEDKKSLEDLLEKQQALQNKVEELKKQNQQNNKQQNEYNPLDESILEKQKQLEELFDKVMTPEMKKLFDELNRMLESLDKNQVQEKLEELKLTNKDIEKELDRNLEAFRQLEMQQKMQEAIEKLDEMKKKQEELREETTGKKDESEKTGEKQKDKDGEKDEKESGDKSDQKPEQKAGRKEQNEQLSKKQDELRKEFEQLKKELSDLKEKNKELEDPLKLPDTENKEEEISEEMEKSSEQLSKGSKKNASQSQKSASEKMQEMKEQMEQAMEEGEQQQEEENAQALRQILENLLNLSFSQEELMYKLKKTRIDNPQYTDIPREQNKLRDNSRIIEDSLFALSKRAPQISAIVNREISSINMNMDKTVKNLAERNTAESSMRMQSTMKSVNDLALLLNESLEQMQNQMKQKKNGKGGKGGKCNKPGSASGKNPGQEGSPMSNLRKMQEQLNRQLKELKEALEKGEKPGEKPGDKSGHMNSGGSGLPNAKGNSEQFAKMAARQEALRRQIEQLMNNMKTKGRQPGGNMAELMEQTEKDLVNRRISSETMRRQEEILTRLLESEKAEREREQDEQRKSTEAKNETAGNPEQFLEYKRQKEKEMELLITVPPSLTPFYKEKVNNYFNQLNK